MLILPLEQFDNDILQALLEDFVSRDGTDYGAYEYSLQQKCQQLHTQIQQKQAFIVYDALSQNCQILSKEQVHELDLHE